MGEGEGFAGSCFHGVNVVKLFPLVVKSVCLLSWGSTLLGFAWSKSPARMWKAQGGLSVVY